MGDESSKIDLVVEMSSNGEMNPELQTAVEILTRMELDLACASEKLVNLNVLMMHAATKENEFQGTSSMSEELPGDSLEVLEFDLLSRILDSEVIEVEKFIKSAQENFLETCHMVSSYEHLGNTTMGMEDRLHDSEESLKRLHDQVSEIREQSARFFRTLSCLNRGENWNNDEATNFSVDGQFSDSETKVKMQTAEQQRRILRMLEKSLAREMDVEKKLNESRQVEEDLKRRLLYLEQEFFYTEEEVVDVYEKCFASENAAEVLLETSKELLSKLKIVQFNLTGSNQREVELKLQLSSSREQLESKENALRNLNSSRQLNDVQLEQTNSLKQNLAEAEENLILSNKEASILRENISVLEKQLSDSKVSRDGSYSEHTLEGLRDEDEVRDLNAKSILDLNMDQFKAMSERVASLEKQLAESDIKLQHARASADASQERENMLNATIRDMETVIEDLKSKVLRAENLADSAEDKCIILSESNVELNEELSFLRARLGSMEQAEETKVSAAKDIDFRSKVLKDLVMQLASERGHLHKQMAKLALDNKNLVLKLRQKQKDPTGNRGYGEHFSPVDRTKKSTANSQADKTQKESYSSESEGRAMSECAQVERRIDAGVISFKHVLMAVLILLISATAYLFLPLQH